MLSFEDLKDRKEKIAVVGLGYVGLPLALLLSSHFDVIGFDIDEKKIAELQAGKDRTGEVNVANLRQANVLFTANAAELSNSRFIIVAVPTPVDKETTPDISILQAASSTVGKHLSKGSIVVFESTVYPGVTEDICAPIIAKESGFELNEDFFIGYSPERVNPGDSVHTIDKITKIVAGSSHESEQVIAEVYKTITNIFCAASIRVAEAAKVIENTQRDIN
ncbi:MAG: nucleotide sugar dehydrogenase, partial [Candidatus Magasanikbacteria bacterium]|nr:nucleotide sugar dehydrogenase [Candidatus Magasanikbacteria bacterium]